MRQKSMMKANPKLNWTRNLLTRRGSDINSAFFLPARADTHLRADMPPRSRSALALASYQSIQKKREEDEMIPAEDATKQNNMVNSKQPPLASSRISR